ncbi:MAG: hypothetical protein M3Z09_17335 [Acidobacteriota bacterium]|nr:hypothetical protein [Acidobacteriota bacterium]
MKPSYRLTTAALLILLASCSSAPKPKEAANAPEPVTGLHALAQMFSSARSWQPDALVLRVNSLNIGKLKPQPGRAEVWQGIFVSPTAGQSRTYTFSVVDVSTSVRSGIFPDPPAPFSAKSQTAQPFNIAAARKDTDEVYQTALKHAADYTKSHPDQEVNYLLELNNRAPDAMWRIFWGPSISASGFSVLVDASSGEFFETLK